MASFGVVEFTADWRIDNLGVPTADKWSLRPINNSPRVGNGASCQIGRAATECALRNASEIAHRPRLVQRIGELGREASKRARGSATVATQMD